MRRSNIDRADLNPTPGSEPYGPSRIRKRSITRQQSAISNHQSAITIHPSPIKSSALPPTAWRVGRRGPPSISKSLRQIRGRPISDAPISDGS